MAKCLPSIHKLWIQSYHCWEENKKGKKEEMEGDSWLLVSHNINYNKNNNHNVFFETRSQIAQADLELAIYLWMTLNFWSSQVLRLQTCATTQMLNVLQELSTLSYGMGTLFFFSLFHKWVNEGMGAMKGLVQILFLVDWSKALINHLFSWL